MKFRELFLEANSNNEELRRLLNKDAKFPFVKKLILNAKGTSVKITFDIETSDCVKELKSSSWPTKDLDSYKSIIYDTFLKKYQKVFKDLKKIKGKVSKLKGDKGDGKLWLYKDSEIEVSITTDTSNINSDSIDELGVGQEILDISPVSKFPTNKQITKFIKEWSIIGKNLMPRIKTYFSGDGEGYTIEGVRGYAIDDIISSLERKYGSSSIVKKYPDAIYFIKR